MQWCHCWGEEVGVVRARVVEADITVAQLKAVRRGLKIWSKRSPYLDTLIFKRELVITELDHLEEARSQSVVVRNFRRIIKVHMAHLCSLKKVIWQQRCSIRWVFL